MLTTSPIAMFTQTGVGGVVGAGSGWSSGTSWIIASIAVVVLGVFAWRFSRHRR